MKLEKGMSLTQKRTLKEILKENMAYACMIPDDFTDWGWQITDVHKIAWHGMKLVIYTIKNKTIQMGVQVNEEVLRIYFSPWCDWKEVCTSLGEKYYYKTNQRLTFVKKEYDGKVFKGWSACHSEDAYSLNEGINLALYRIDEKIRAYKEEKDKTTTEAKKINVHTYTKTNKTMTFGTTIDIGDRFGDLEVIAYVGKDSSRHHLWKCRCACGNVIIVRSTNLRNNSKTSCGKCKVAMTNKNPIWGSTSIKEQINMKKNIEDISKTLDIDVYDKNLFENNKIQLENEFYWVNNNFILQEHTGDLLEAHCYNYIIHTVSGDFKEKGAMGINRRIIDLFNIEDDLISEIDFLKRVGTYGNWLYAEPNSIKGEIISYSKNVLSVIVKESCYDKVTYNTIGIVLENLRKFVERNHITHIAMSRICCGRDELDWEIIRQYIIDAFKDVDYKLTITVYHN